MGKTGKWIRGLFTGKREKYADLLPSGMIFESRSGPIPSAVPKEKKRWSFRRSTGARKELVFVDSTATIPAHLASEAETDLTRHKKVVASAAAAAAAAQAASVVIRLSAASRRGRSSNFEEVAATKIQSAFRAHLARKALRALKALVKLQALVRGYLVRKQATAALRCMQALVTVQARARAQRIRMVEEAEIISEKQSVHGRSPSPQGSRFRRAYGYEIDQNMEENVKIVEMDLGEFRGGSRSRNSYSTAQSERTDHQVSPYYDGAYVSSTVDLLQQFSPAPSALTDSSPRPCSGHYEEFSFHTVQSSPQCFSTYSKPDSRREHYTDSQQEDTYPISNEYAFCPNYMANTESSRAKARSQSAPKQRPETCERQTSRRRPSVESRNIPKGVRMQRSSSQTVPSLKDYQYPWSIKLDRSNISLKDSECGSTSTLLTNTTYFRSLESSDVHGSRY